MKLTMHVGIAISTVWLLWPYVSLFLWAVFISIAVHPLFIMMRDRLKIPLALVITGLLSLGFFVLILPFFLLFSTFLSSSNDLLELFNIFKSIQLSDLPHWLLSIPFLKDAADNLLFKLHNETYSLIQASKDTITKIVLLGLNKTSFLGFALLEMLAAILLAIVFLVYEKNIRQYVHFLFSHQALEAFKDQGMIVKNTIQIVTTGIIGTAMLQTLLAFLGLLFTGAPATFTLSLFCFILCVLQLPPAIILLPVSAWLFYQGHAISAILLSIHAIIILGTVETIVKPLLLRNKMNIPILVLFIGLIAGLTQLGLIGIFLGPIITSLSYLSIKAWLQQSKN